MIWLSGAAVLSFIWLGVHLFVGGKEIAVPLRQSTDLPPIVRDTQYLCWHFTSCAIALMAGCFAAAVWLNDPTLAWPATILALGFAIIGIGLVAKIGQSHMRLPQGWLFVPVALAGAIGLATL